MFLSSSALMDMKIRSVDTSLMMEICPRLENRLSDMFDDMLWMLMQNAAEKTHVSMEPWYSCLDPNLPGFQPLEEDHDDDRNLYEHTGHGYVKAPKRSELRKQKMKDEGWKPWSLLSFFGTTVDEKKAKGEHTLLL